MTGAIADTACQRDAEGNVSCRQAEDMTQQQPGAARDAERPPRDAADTRSQPKHDETQGAGEVGGRTSQDRAHGLTY